MPYVPPEVKERIKREISIQRLAEARGIKLTRSGKELIGLCPFHDDRNPSLNIDPVKNVWSCKGACGEGGDVIRWVERAEGVSFTHAVEMLKREHFSLAAGLAAGPIQTVKQSTVRKLPPLIDATADDKKLLGIVVDYYHGTLKRSPEAQRYLGEKVWRASYIAQGDQKRAQIDQMIRFSENNQCRMMSLVRHFGDGSDGATSCGVCDFCAPAKCVAQRFRTATDVERSALYRVLNAMKQIRTRSTGKLYMELFPGNEISRDNFEEILGAMARAGLLIFADAVFEKDGKQIPYRTVSLTPAGRMTNETMPVLFVMKEAARPVAKRKLSKKSGKSKRARATAVRKPGGTKVASVSESDQRRIEQALRSWRLGEAKRRRVPAFRIFGDRALLTIAATAPRNEAELLTVQGIGAGIAKKYGSHIFRVIAAAR